MWKMNLSWIDDVIVNCALGDGDGDGGDDDDDDGEMTRKEMMVLHCWIESSYVLNQQYLKHWQRAKS